ncbi:hypothetical protein QQF64_019794 [Cirrhinus molitorella]|uniref:Uncharacterized protein n=1 Tax=Cirrhinus molitorella TaxID=172907 RepID=A0ABR3LGH1_9TELE
MTSPLARAQPATSLVIHTGFIVFKQLRSTLNTVYLRFISASGSSGTALFVLLSIKTANNNEHMRKLPR